MIRLTRDLYVAEEKILSAEVHNTTVLVQFNDGTPAGRTVEVPPFKDRDAAERWVNNGFSDRPESDFEDSAPAPTVGQPLDAPVSSGHPVTAAQVKEGDETVCDEDAEKIAAAVGVPAGMMPAQTLELAEIRERELKEIEEIQDVVVVDDAASEDVSPVESADDQSDPSAAVVSSSDAEPDTEEIGDDVDFEPADGEPFAVSVPAEDGDVLPAADVDDERDDVSPDETV